MTDKQLALLLRQLAGRIRSLANEVETIIDGNGELEARSRLETTKTGETIGVTRLVDVHPAAVWRILDLAEEFAEEVKEMDCDANEEPGIAQEKMPEHRTGSRRVQFTKFAGLNKDPLVIQGWFCRWSGEPNVVAIVEADSGQVYEVAPASVKFLKSSTTPQ